MWSRPVQTQQTQNPSAFQELLAVLQPPVAPKLLSQGFRNMRQKRVVVTHYGGPEVITAVEEDTLARKQARYG